MKIYLFHSTMFISKLMLNVSNSAIRRKKSNFFAHFPWNFQFFVNFYKNKTFYASIDRSQDHTHFVSNFFLSKTKFAFSLFSHGFLNPIGSKNNQFENIKKKFIYWHKRYAFFYYSTLNLHRTKKHTHHTYNMIFKF